MCSRRFSPKCRRSRSITERMWRYTEWYISRFNSMLIRQGQNAIVWKKKPKILISLKSEGIPLTAYALLYLIVCMPRSRHSGGERLQRDFDVRISAPNSVALLPPPLPPFQLTWPLVIVPHRLEAELLLLLSDPRRRRMQL